VANRFKRSPSKAAALDRKRSFILRLFLFNSFLFISALIIFENIAKAEQSSFLLTLADAKKVVSKQCPGFLEEQSCSMKCVNSSLMKLIDPSYRMISADQYIALLDQCQANTRIAELGSKTFKTAKRKRAKKEEPIALVGQAASSEASRTRMTRQELYERQGAVTKISFDIPGIDCSQPIQGYKKALQVAKRRLNIIRNSPGSIAMPSVASVNWRISKLHSRMEKYLDQCGPDFRIKLK